ncbi:conserved hypothetical protein [Listeria seeligeri FSL S4-171]|uniref:Uncharacterized protein n=1 Tax=Listeria seeligeri FSL N1-067 TaxID=702453 RepID=E3ZRG2_LISSE|nr:conserved hypothetical protein [Listeria seeligeri FSL N1-067]EFS02879.1 conserved hypothetical protein [Listeria seeligeri FSL S4-171]
MHVAASFPKQFLTFFKLFCPIDVGLAFILWYDGENLI